ncbi:membrane protein [Candidatus Paracaedimonas acanthamoebae]|nr:membrane protein [Candidatus Paracaedimonas acanthamoebae]
MDVLIIPMLELLRTILQLYIWVFIASVVLSWLISFQIVNTHNRVVVVIGEALYRLTEPMLAPLRRIIPGVSGFDFSPMVAIFILVFMQNVVSRLILKFMGVA